MNKVIIINLNGNAYHLEENGYDALRAYLDNAGRRLEGNPDKDEIIADIEQAIADKFRALLGANKSVVVTRDVESVIAEMGTVEDSSGAGPQPGAQQASKPEQAKTETHGPAKRLYKVHEGAMIAGVCNGIAAYFNIDVTVVRVIFAILSATYGSGLLLYVLLALLLPTAVTSAEKSEAFGAPSTSQEFIRRARQGYYEGMKTFGNKQAYREWKRKFKQEMRGWGHSFSRDFHQNTDQWAQNWRRHWGGKPHPGAWFVVPVLTVLCVIFWLVAVSAIVSLISHGTVMGIAFFSGMPTWIGIVLIVMFFSLLTWPLKVMKRSLYWGYHPGWCGPGPHVFGSLVWVAAILAFVWFAQQHSFHFREAVNDLPHALHRAVDDVKDWWDRQ
jgi:phage shock protein PspC (stress-responsive transcriptional regulator)